MLPLSRLEPRLSTSSSGSVETVSGMPPERELLDRSTVVSQMRSPMCAGICPLRALELRLRWVMPPRWVMVSGMAPEMRLPERSRCVRLGQCQWCGRKPDRLALEMVRRLRWSMCEMTTASSDGEPVARGVFATVSSVRLARRESQTAERRPRDAVQEKDRRPAASCSGGRSRGGAAGQSEKASARSDGASASSAAAETEVVSEQLVRASDVTRRNGAPASQDAATAPPASQGSPARRAPRPSARSAS
uniref:Uncharacterized protein n=1 Tax=Triticum urartu TaxID=4572 RepID=A0A8R7PV35_TRIUA